VMRYIASTKTPIAPAHNHVSCASPTLNFEL
jgi:hypothetical protein